MRTWLLALFGLMWIGCGPAVEPMDGGTDAPRPDTGPTDLSIGSAERPARVVFPMAHDGTTELPLVILLHGYGANSTVQNLYFQLTNRARTAGMYVLLADGTEDAGGSQFWNATDGCCNFGGSTVDDAGYLTSLLDEAEAALPIDSDRIYFMGHSNGGFMSYRMACEIGDRIAAIASLAGSDFEADDTCVPDRAPSVLQIHGTADETIAYTGGAVSTASFPGAVDVVERWAGRAGCDVTMPTDGTPFDFMGTLPGDETAVTDYTTGCTEGRGATLWTIEGGGHIPGVTQPAFTNAILDWLMAHPRR
jgi:polyhydroxybutyrate depolymerase